MSLQARPSEESSDRPAARRQAGSSPVAAAESARPSPREKFAVPWPAMTHSRSRSPPVSSETPASCRLSSANCVMLTDATSEPESTTRH